MNMESSALRLIKRSLFVHCRTSQREAEPERPPMLLDSLRRYVHAMLRVSLYCSESESDIAFRWVHRESNLMFILSSDKDQREKLLSRSLLISVNEV